MKDIAIGLFCLGVIIFAFVSIFGVVTGRPIDDLEPYETTGLVMNSEMDTTIAKTWHVVVRTEADVIILDLTEYDYYLANMPQVGMTCKVTGTPYSTIFENGYFFNLRECE